MCKDWSATERCSWLGVWTLASGLEWTGKCSVFEECPTECKLGVYVVYVSKIEVKNSQRRFPHKRFGDYREATLRICCWWQFRKSNLSAIFKSRHFTQGRNETHLSSPLTSVPHPLPYTHHTPPPLFPPTRMHANPPPPSTCTPWHLPMWLHGVLISTCPSDYTAG